MSLRKIAGLAAGFALAVGLIGGGVSATFTGTATANQQINVGRMSVVLTPTTHNASLQPDGSILCDAVLITTTDGTGPICGFTVTSTGTIPATHYTVSQTESGLSAAQLSADPEGDGKFGTTAMPFMHPTESWGLGSTLPATLQPAPTWGTDAGVTLDSSDFGTSFWITYTVTFTS